MSAALIAIIGSLVVIGAGAFAIEKRAGHRIDKLAGRREKLRQAQHENLTKLEALRGKIASMSNDGIAESDPALTRMMATAPSALGQLHAAAVIADTGGSNPWFVGRSVVTPSLFTDPDGNPFSPALAARRAMLRSVDHVILRGLAREDLASFARRVKRYEVYDIQGEPLDPKIEFESDPPHNPFMTR